MSVVIDEVIAEPALQSSPPRQEQSGAGPQASAFDMDQFNFERKRSWHRRERLWAD